ncbi:MAG: hypothetical protein NTV22_07040 [bacterium]|nr:hypothetical protein [bacterium]
MTTLQFIALSVCCLVCVPAAAATPVPAPAPACIAMRLDPRTNMFRIQPEYRVTAAARQRTAADVFIRFLHSGQTGYWGDVALDWPASASNAVLYAAALWAIYLNSPVQITLEACWTASLGPGVLGHSGAIGASRDFSGAPQTNTWYQIALANALHGSDLDPAKDDFAMAFSSSFSWYYDTNGLPPIGQVDLVSVVLHEVCHGLGFAGSMRISAGVGSWGYGTPYPYIYDRFTENGISNALLNTTLFPNPSVALRNQLISANIFFNGAAANAGNGGPRPKLYCPAVWSDGSSYAHLNDATYDGTSNALMTSSIGFGEAIHIPGPVTLGLLNDEGWVVVPEPAVIQYGLLVAIGIVLRLKG